MIKNVRKIIQSKLSELGRPVSFRDIPDSSQFPYIVYDLRRLTADSETESGQYVFEVNVWGRATSTEVSDILDGVESIFHRFQWIDENCEITVYPGQRQFVDDEDKIIKRIREQFEMHCFIRREN